MINPTRHSADPTAPPRPRVLVFDSGVGGLSILAHIRRDNPHCELVYACDNGAFPYGTKSAPVLLAQVDTVLKALAAQIKPDIIVVACNTASTVVLPHIRAHFVYPIVGVVPAIKPAAASSRSGVIGVLATPATVKRPYTQQLIDEFAHHCTVYRLGSVRLVEIAEEKLRGIAPNPAELRHIISPLFDDPDLDSVVLACTHFPLLAAELAAAAPHPVQWIDSGEAIARRVQSLLPAHHHSAGQATANDGFDCWLSAGGHADLEAGLRRFGARQIAILSH